MKLLDKWALNKVGKLVEAKSINLQDPNNFQKAFDDYFNLAVNPENYVGSVFDAIDTWGWYFAKALFRVYKTSRGDKKEDLSKRMLFDNPNPYSVWKEMSYMLAGQMGLFGKSFIFKKRRGNTPSLNKGEVIGYQLLLPSLVTLKDAKDVPIAYYEYQDGTNKINIHRDNIIFIRYPNPNGGLNGYPIVSSILDQSEVNKLQMAYAKKFFKQGGFLGLAFSTTQQMTPTNFKRTLAMLEDKYKGIENAYEIGLFDSGLQPIKSAFSLKDMDFGTNRELTRDDIFAAFKVPKILVGLGESINRATAEASIYQFTSGVIDPVLSYIDQILTKDFIMEYGEEYSVVHDILAPKDQEGKLSYYSNGLKEGWLTINEVREAEGWNKVEGEIADSPTINVGGALVSVSTGKQLAVENQPQQMNKKDASDDLLWKKFDRRHELASRKFGKNVFGYIDDQQRRILEAVKDNFIAEQAFDLEKENMLLYQLLEVDLWDILRGGYKYGAFSYGISPSGFNKVLLTDDFNRLSKNALLFNETTFNQLKTTEDEVSLRKTLNRLNIRAEDLITTSVTGSLNAGLLRAMIDAGLTRKKWLTMRDGRVRTPKGTHLEDHVSMDGIIVDINDTFKLTNRQGGLDECMYPGDPSLSPENLINDRCTIVGVE